MIIIVRHDDNKKMEPFVRNTLANKIILKAERGSLNKTNTRDDTIATVNIFRLFALLYHHEALSMSKITDLC